MQNTLINLDVSFLSDSDNLSKPITNQSGGHDDSINTDQFIDLLSSKLSNMSGGLNVPSSNVTQTHSNIDADSDAFSDINFITAEEAHKRATKSIQNGGSGTDLDTIMKIAREYLNQNGGGGDDDDSELSDTDDSLDDSDSKSSSDIKEKKIEKKTKKTSEQSGHGKKKSKKSKPSKQKMNMLSDSINVSDTIESYRTQSVESFGGSQYVDSQSINTSSINLVAFENPALTTNIKKQELVKTKGKRGRKPSKK